MRLCPSPISPNTISLSATSCPDFVRDIVLASEVTVVQDVQLDRNRGVLPNRIQALETLLLCIGLAQIAEHSSREPETVFTTLAHHMDEDFLTEAFHQLRKDAAAGIDEMTVAEYSPNLKESIADLHQRLVNRNRLSAKLG